MGGGQVGDDVGGDTARQQPLEQFGGVAGEGDRGRLRGKRTCGERQIQCLVELIADDVDDALVVPAPRLAGVGLGDQRDPTEHPRDRDGLGGAHAAEPGRDDQPAAQRAAEVLTGDLRERLVGALQHALGADVLPAAGRQAAPGDQVAPLEVIEHLRGRPAADEVGVGQQHDRRARPGRQHRDRLARLHHERVAVLDRSQRVDDRAEAVVIAGDFGVGGVDDEVVRVLGDRQVVLQQPQDRLLAPAPAAQVCADLRHARRRCWRTRSDRVRVQRAPGRRPRPAHRG